MKTIEERAERYMLKRLKDYETFFGEDLREAYIKGATDEYTLLTEWHDPEKETPNPENEDYVLVRIGSPFVASNYLIATYLDGDWHYPNGEPLEDYITVLGWREIHE